MDYGYHPPTMYFPLIVHGSLMIEPTESETKETLDAFIYALKAIAHEARTTPDVVKTAPHAPGWRRFDERRGPHETPCCATRSLRLTSINAGERSWSNH